MVVVWVQRKKNCVLKSVLARVSVAPDEGRAYSSVRRLVQDVAGSQFLRVDIGLYEHSLVLRNRLPSRGSSNTRRNERLHFSVLLSTARHRYFRLHAPTMGCECAALFTASELLALVWVPDAVDSWPFDPHSGSSSDCLAFGLRCRIEYCMSKRVAFELFTLSCLPASYSNSRRFCVSKRASLDEYSRV